LFESSLKIGSLVLPHRLIQGPLAGYSCAPFRESFMPYRQPAYCVTEMISAHDVLTKHKSHSRYLFKSPNEGLLCYQLSGTCPDEMAQAAVVVEKLGADLIDINCGCPKPKIRKKGAGSALLETPDVLVNIIKKVKQAIQVPLTVKIRLQEAYKDIELSQAIEQAGADALIVHGRTYRDDYDKPCDYAAIYNVKKHLGIPVIANGDIQHQASLKDAMIQTACDGFMIARAGCGKPWLYQHLLEGAQYVSWDERYQSFQRHIEGLINLENAYQALLQSRSLIKYYFRDGFSLDEFYKIEDIRELMEKVEHKIRELCAQVKP